ncbi:hypothetical protein GTG28_06470 [Vibrio sp. OCN044]|uniref:Uncharacterized protein n=1 Tax=Vibrio tetraodonis subsp. pristinus TaxID=2695891 RepID=A0A6L8LTN3_9VIBR|nr:RNase A-like domain-containing protein [Vibrio tetraodonis]MYM58863.1 hypothetical protein [Vibrio tetraodonis subsp. pristinus]
MYKQVNKPKGNKSRSISNSVAQKKSNGKQSLGFVDDRPKAIVQRLFNDALYDKQFNFIKQWREFDVINQVKPKDQYSELQIKQIYKKAKDSFFVFDIGDLYNNRSDIDGYIHREERSVEKDRNSHSISKHLAVDDAYLLERVKKEPKVKRATRFTDKIRVGKAMEYWMNNGQKILTEYGYHLGGIFSEIVELCRKQKPPKMEKWIKEKLDDSAILEPYENSGYIFELQKVPDPKSAAGNWRIECKWKATTKAEYSKRAIEKSDLKYKDVREPATIFPPNGVDMTVSVTNDGQIEVTVPEDVMGTFF